MRYIDIMEIKINSEPLEISKGSRILYEQLLCDTIVTKNRLTAIFRNSSLLLHLLK